MDYQVASDMASTSSAYSYYPNYHNHSHLHHHHHHMHNTSPDILTSHSLPNQSTTTQLTQAASSPINLYHEYGLTMEPSYYEAEAYYGNHSNLNDHLSPTHQSYAATANTNAHSEPTTSHIISSDNGLSYTNLDYIYGQAHPYLHQSNDKSTASIDYSATSAAVNIESNNLHHSQSQSQSLWTAQQSTHHQTTTAFLDNTAATNQQMAHQQLSCISNQTTINIMTQTANDLPNTRNFNRSEPRNNTPNNIQPTNSNSQPTYKWMQVKRNVPKPQG